MPGKREKVRHDRQHLERAGYTCIYRKTLCAKEREKAHRAIVFWTPDVRIVICRYNDIYSLHLKFNFRTVHPVQPVLCVRQYI